MTKGHTDREYQSQLEDLRTRLLRMAGLIEQMTVDSMRALVDGNAQLARATIAQDRVVNRLEVEADELCLRILARWQPMASDLRFVTHCLKMVTDLERIGDLAVNICERVIDLSGHSYPWGWSKAEAMAQLVREMIADTIRAFVDGQADVAQAVVARDNEVDELYTGLFREIFDEMTKNPALLSDGIHALSVAKWIERMGDHCTNLAEQVVFMLKGKDIRHSGKRPTPSEPA